MKTPLKISLIALLLIGACKKYEIPKDSSTENLNSNLEAPQDFSWSSAQDLRTSLSFESGLASETFAFEILDGNFNRVLKLFKEAGMTQMPLDQSISGEFDSLYVYAPDQGVFVPFATQSGSVSIRPGDGNSLSGAYPPVTNEFNDRFGQKTGCSSCTVTLPSGNTNATYNSNTKVCVTGTSSGSFTFGNGGEINVCGTLTINNLNINGGLVHVYIAPGGKLIVKSMNMNGRGTIVNDGELVFNNTYSFTTYFLNRGTVEAKGTLNINSGSSSTPSRIFVNEGDISVVGDMNVDFESYNHSSIVVNGNFKNNTNLFVNNCSLEARNNLHINKIFRNNAFIKVGAVTYINGGSTPFLKNLSLIKTRDLHLNAVLSSDGIGVIAVSGNTTINSGFGVSAGLLDLCDANGIETNNAYGSALSKLRFCENSVQADGNCFAEGHVVVGDTDPVGHFCYPSTGSAYRAFEDLWPAKGDYDFNDLIIKYDYIARSNSKNKLISIEFNITLPALGASHKNGIAMQLFTKNGNTYARHTGGVYRATQQGVSIDSQDPDVMIISPDVFAMLPKHYRNVGDGAEGTPYSFNVTVLVDPAAQIDLSNLYVDLFLIRSNNRGLEVHMPGIPPSTAASNLIFNTVDDRSQSNGWYRTSNNMPWAIEIISSVNWKHPLSKVPVWQAYPDFTPWVNSSGSLFTTWYTNPNNSLVYQLLIP